MVVNPQYKRRSSLFVTLDGLSTLACSMRQYSGFGVVTTQAQYNSPLGFASTTPKDVVVFILVFRFSFFSLAFSLFVFSVLFFVYLSFFCLFFSLLFSSLFFSLLFFSFLSFPVVFLSFLALSKSRLSHRGLDVQVGLQHVPDQHPNSVSMTLLSSPVQAQSLLPVLHTNVAAQGHQLGHHRCVTPQAGPHEDVPPVAALVLNGQPQRGQQLNQL